ncbi:hypothetical protein [Sphingopyxis sp. DBS4]|uniref:hypothetical protein n=1 Tax=Sphingopyxis sp. DBS4 TaxID=2968500 RepID=UPI00214CB260|nr:hypothetical protein [Sphingopyxis sp. DBS4]
MDDSTVRSLVKQFATEHMHQMQNVPWDAFAKHLRERFPRSGGETFGCEEDGQYFDIGDKVEWVSELDGDIRLTAFARADCNGNSIFEELSTVIGKPCEEY